MELVCEALETQIAGWPFRAGGAVGRMGNADEIAAAVLWLCSPGASFVLGAALPVDGGFTAH